MLSADRAERSVATLYLVVSGSKIGRNVNLSLRRFVHTKLKGLQKVASVYVDVCIDVYANFIYIKGLQEVAS